MYGNANAIIKPTTLYAKFKTESLFLICRDGVSGFHITKRTLVVGEGLRKLLKSKDNNSKYFKRNFSI